MNHSIKPFLRRTEPYSGESLPSLMARLAQLNYYPRLERLVQLCAGQYSPETLLRPPDVGALNYFASLVQQPSPQLYQHTLYRFAKTLTPLPVRLEQWVLTEQNRVLVLPKGVWVRHTLSEQKAQFCPLCLQQQPYHRLTWATLAITTCLEHHCLLWDCCPHCSEKVSVEDVVRNHCHHCQGRLSEAEMIDLKGDVVGLACQQALQAWLVGQTGSLSIAEAEPRALYWLLVGLQRLILSDETTWRRVKQDTTLSLPKRIKKSDQSPSIRHDWSTMAFKGVQNWPQGLFDLFDTYFFDEKGRRRKTALPVSSWYKQHWQHSALNFLHQAITTYLKKRGGRIVGLLPYAHQGHSQPRCNPSFAVTGQQLALWPKV
ncbi:TniQ family protein [Anaerolineales bacterium HSG6]|nr:TniQ family protein [Anaerolineales bacterium HSG6]